jgi:hypothetical protein
VAHIPLPEGVPGMRALLTFRPEIGPSLGALTDVLAGRVQQGGRAVREEDIARARHESATDLEIHDTVLIAAAFCLFNRYVDGLAAWTPPDPDAYRARARQTAEHGYAAGLPRVPRV